MYVYPKERCFLSAVLNKVSLSDQRDLSSRYTLYVCILNTKCDHIASGSAELLLSFLTKLDRESPLKQYISIKVLVYNMLD